MLCHKLSLGRLLRSRHTNPLAKWQGRQDNTRCFDLSTYRDLYFAMMYDIRDTHIWRYTNVKYFLCPQAPQGKWSSKVAGGVKEDWWRFFETWRGAWLAQNPTSHKILSKNERSSAGTFSPTIFFHTRLLSSTWTSLQHCWGGASPSLEVSFLFYPFFRKKTGRILASHVPMTFLYFVPFVCSVFAQ